MNEDFNDGIKIAIARMESNPEEFFEPKAGGKWSWLYAETTREVLTEEERVAVHSALKKVRRLEITYKATKAVLPELEESYDPQLIQPPIGKDGKYSTAIQQAQNQQLRALMDSGNLTSVSKGGTGTTATTGWFKDIFK